MEEEDKVKVKVKLKVKVEEFEEERKNERKRESGASKPFRITVIVILWFLLDDGARKNAAELLHPRAPRRRVSHATHDSLSVIFVYGVKSASHSNCVETSPLSWFRPPSHTQTHMYMHVYLSMCVYAYAYANVYVHLHVYV